MSPPAKRALLPIALVAVLTAVLVLLAVLQYRWSLEISRAERTRIEASLNTSVNQYRQEFYRELTQVSTTFHSDPTADPDDFWTVYADRYQDWTRTAARPDLISNVYVFQTGKAGDTRLLQLRLAEGEFAPAAWPANLETLRARLDDEAHQPLGPGAQGMPPVLRTFVWTLEERIPALVHPIYHFSDSPRRRGGMLPGPMGGGPEGPPAREILGFAIIELNRGAIDRMLGELAQRYFAGPEGFIYNVAVVSGAPDNKIIYRSDPELTSGSLNPPDAQAALVPATPAETRGIDPFQPRALTGTRKRNGGGRNGSGRSGGNRGVFPPRAHGAFILPSAAEAPWQLLARHRGGSLESVVAADRRRNLVLSFGVLLLLAASMALIVSWTQRARRLAHMQMEFVAGVSHELRTPVAVICSAADNLAEGFVGSKEQVKEYGSLIRNEGRRLAGMIEQILRFASGQARQANYTLEPVSVNEAVERVLAGISALPAAEGFTVERAIDASLPPVKADAAALNHCLENLILNALKYGGDARWVRVSAASASGGTRVRIAVEDHGAGIEAADLPHIFEPFYRGRAAQAAQIHGAGLGLSLAREIAQEMGGRLDAASEEGAGAKFTLELQAVDPSESAASPVLKQTA